MSPSACLAQRLNQRAAEQGVAAERLDRGDFAIQKRYDAFPIYRRDTFQPPAERQAVGPRLRRTVL